MRKILLASGELTLVDDQDFEYLNQFTWRLVSGYARREVNADKRRQYFYMHREVAQAPRGKQVDHINGNALDNRQCNLRLCTQGENLMNRGKTTRNTSGYKGVTFFKNRRKGWVAQIKAGSKRVCTYHMTPLEAAKDYNRLALQYHGEFAYLNGV